MTIKPKRQLVRDRLMAGDPVCAGYLAEAEATLASLPLARRTLAASQAEAP